MLLMMMMMMMMFCLIYLHNVSPDGLQYSDNDDDDDISTMSKDSFSYSAEILTYPAFYSTMFMMLMMMMMMMMFCLICLHNVSPDGL